MDAAVRGLRADAGPATARIAAGCLCVLGVRARRGAPVPGRVRPLRGPRPPNSADRLALVLAVRYLAQAWAIESGHGGGVRLRVGIEALHGLTMALGAATMPRYRTEALAALLMAAAVALVDAAQATAAGSPSARTVRRSVRGRLLRARGAQS